MDNARALNPQNSVVVEACAGSGKTWLLVSRIVRLLLSGVKPSEILAITFTRKAAQEMQARLRDWLYELASADDEKVRAFLRERAVAEAEIESLLPRARSLYQQYLLAQPAITISTFHGWFMQILQRAPLNTGMAGGVQLLEQTAELWQEAWQTFLAELQHHPDSENASAMLALFEEYGLSNTQKMLRNFANKRSEWWAYTAGQTDPLAYALENLRTEFEADLSRDPLAELFTRPAFFADVRAFAAELNASAAQLAKAARVVTPLDGTLPVAQSFALLWEEFFTLKNEPRSIKPNKGQDAAAFTSALDVVRAQLLSAYQQQQAQQIYRMNQNSLRCGVALLETYQKLKQQKQALDFGDLEWRVRQLLNDSDHAEYLQYKLDSRYHHVLLDEFQDTNPLQWQVLQAWFAAAAAVQSTPKIFLVGDPKQSIYRFRRADARLFGVASAFLIEQFSAEYIPKNITRRNSPAVLRAVNGVFDNLNEYAGFETHEAYQQNLPGYVAVVPLAQAPAVISPEKLTEDSTGKLSLRNPLTEPYPSQEETARAAEAAQFADKLCDMVGRWQVRANGKNRAAQWGDIMVLVRRRTHLKTYEQALRARHIPHLTSRRGGLLDTLEASDIQALLTFLITPFADLQLAHSLRTPIFSCTDADLMLLGKRADEESEKSRSWWSRLQTLVAAEQATATLLRAHHLLQNWLKQADILPVHDLLDRIYFEGDVQARYQAAMPEAMRATVMANLQAFLEMALNVDAGRYPSLPGFLREVAELRKADDNEAPDEGKVSQQGNAVRIYTVHEAKGLEAPIVWLLDSNAKPPADSGYDALVAWPTGAERPAHFSLYADKSSQGTARADYFAADAALAQREDLNLLYVAMTRAQQVLLVSGSGEVIADAWYERIAKLTLSDENPLLGDALFIPEKISQTIARVADARLNQPLPVGTRKIAMSEAQRRGVWLHGLMQHLAPPAKAANAATLQQRLNIPDEHFAALWAQAQQLLGAPQLQRFFDATHYLSASNELEYINARGELRRIDRLVEFATEVWVLDYKTATAFDPARHAQQMEEYRAAMRSIYPSKKICCALIDGEGKLLQS